MFVGKERSSRKEFWLFVLMGNLSSLIAMFFLTLIDYLEPSGMAAALGGLVWLAYLVGLLIALVAISIRRLHDTNRNGAFIFLVFVPLGGIVLLILHCLQGTDGDNKYGPKPLQETNLANQTSISTQTSYEENEVARLRMQIEEAEAAIKRDLPE